MDLKTITKHVRDAEKMLARLNDPDGISDPSERRDTLTRAMSSRSRAEAQAESATIRSDDQALIRELILRHCEELEQQLLGVEL